MLLSHHGALGAKGNQNRNLDVQDAVSVIIFVTPPALRYGGVGPGTKTT